MKRHSIQITEGYTYDSYKEFENHYKEMLKDGFKPHSISDSPEYYVNHEMDHYYAYYIKYKIEH